MQNSSHKAQEWDILRSIAFIVNAILGVGIFMMPTLLIAFGYNSLIGLLISSIVTLFIGFTFISLTKKNKGFEGFDYYVRKRFGKFSGYLIGTIYWFSTWLGNVVILITWSSYFFALFFPHFPKYISFIFNNLVLWLIYVIASSNSKGIGRFQIIVTIGKLIPLFSISTLGLFYISKVKVSNMLNLHPIQFSSISKASYLVLFNYLGIEGILVRFNQIKSKIVKVFNISMLICMLIYMLGIFAIYSMVSYSTLLHSKAPFIDAGNIIHKDFGYLLGVSIFLSGIGTLISWMDISATIPTQLAKDNLFPAKFKSYKFSMFISNILAILLMTIVLINFAFFESIVSAVVFTSIITYIALILAYLKDSKSIIAAISLVLTIIMLCFVGLHSLLYGLVVALLIALLYFVPGIIKKDYDK